MSTESPGPERYELKKVGAGRPASPSSVGPMPEPSELGHPVAISFVLARTRRISVGVTAFSSYSNGFAFNMPVAFRDPRDGINLSRDVSSRWTAGLHGERPHLSNPFSLRLEFSDGTTAESGRGYGEKVARLLNCLGASGGSTDWKWDWFVSPLPPRGPITFVFEWPEFDLHGRYVVTSSSKIVSSARKSQRLLET